jgi:hypothetical protein
MKGAKADLLTGLHRAACRAIARRGLLESASHMKPLKKIPKFKDEDAEREFWSKADSTDYDWSKAQKLVLPNFRQRFERSSYDCRGDEQS